MIWIATKDTKIQAGYPSVFVREKMNALNVGDPPWEFPISSRFRAVHSDSISTTPSIPVP
jgi:hypothetical protein